MLEGKVAIIEPDVQVVNILQRSFEGANFQVETTTTGKDGLTLCLQYFPQVVLIDADLADGDGFELCSTLRATTRIGHVHIVILAHSMDRKLRIKALETGADDFIIVPFDPDEVTLRVRNALRRAAADNLTDPVTGLPSGRLIQNHLRTLMGKEKGWALLGLTVRHLDPFKDVHGFLAAQEVLRSFAHIIALGVDQWGGAGDFIGYSGGGRFVVITTEEQVGALADGLVENFQHQVPTHYTFREREQGYITVGDGRQVPLMKLDVRQVLPSDGPFWDIRSLTEALG
jgi:PleD family two-component response regulator